MLQDKISRWACGLDFGFAITIFGYQFGISFDLTEWHLVFQHFTKVGYLICFGPFSFDIVDATKYEEPIDPQIFELQDRLFDQEKLAGKYYSELMQEKEAHEQDVVRLAGCGVAALGYGDKLGPENYGYSASYQDTYNLWNKYKQALNEIERLRKKSGGKNVKGKSLSSGKSRRKS